MEKNLNIFQKLLNYIFPKESLGNNDIHTYLSHSEIKRFQPFAKQLSPEQHKTLNSITAIADYKNQTLHNLIERIKLNGEFAIANDLAKMFTFYFENNTFDFITFVPADKKRLIQRGFHLPKKLALETAKDLQIPFQETLIKIKSTKQQTGLKREQRLKNLKNCFGITDNIDLSSCKKCCIIDDVSTTGATLHECAKVLKKEYPQLEIYGIVLGISKG